ncbi:unnamed protein product (macronuclear) [Paramecium tetraurelia]|uniref:GSKIP domain-containing protein n=1 Tax=Paramecium tetraurelia TaxID=5888 RepID=A0C3C0_PARTE|nr:uncharacterized protein GSPATT00034766001 [Paramecium tetraurelia]CAK65287.1 unnamed protein product [Paramecium tetraurelia]|eukprot:XP_001432684.1 hypothetical protein (macronuclear) [Paramecium tetraurelia strain d4-2]
MDFNKEFEEYIKFNYVSKLQIGETVNTITKVQIITLEGEELDLECDIYKGIKVLKYNEVFENMEQLLNKHSQLYSKKFEQDLSFKLGQLAQEVEDDDDEEDDEFD